MLMITKTVGCLSFTEDVTFGTHKSPSFMDIKHSFVCLTLKFDIKICNCRVSLFVIYVSFMQRI